MTSKLKVTTEVPNEIHMTRTFDAPRRLVIQAMTTPDLIKRWLGGVRATVVSAEVDLRVGGKYRYVLRRRDGVEFAFGGVYREISEERAVQTEAFDDYPGEASVTTTWVEHDGKTTLNLVIRFESQAVRDAVIASGMTAGAGELRRARQSSCGCVIRGNGLAQTSIASLRHPEPGILRDHRRFSRALRIADTLSGHEDCEGLTMPYSPSSIPHFLRVVRALAKVSSGVVPVAVVIASATVGCSDGFDGRVMGSVVEPGCSTGTCGCLCGQVTSVSSGGQGGAGGGGGAGGYGGHEMGFVGMPTSSSSSQGGGGAGGFGGHEMGVIINPDAGSDADAK